MMTSLSLHPHYDELMISLEQINALLDVITSVDLTDLKLTSIATYFWVVYGIANKAKTNCENLANLAILGDKNDAN